MASTTQDAELTLCDLEPITRLERIQSFGFLMAISKDWVVTRASLNLGQFIDTDATVVLGKPLDAMVDAEALHDIRNRLTGLSATGGTERLFGIPLIVGRPYLDLAVHYVGNLCILEGEAAGLDNQKDAASMVRKMLARLGKQPSLEAFHGDAARQVRAMTGFDRVMIYRFEPAGSGEVIAEATAAGADSFLGLHYPASDIPVQARALYVRNPFRIIADVQSPAVPLIAGAADCAVPLDLSLAITRAVSPVHLEYLRNMGVGASLSISILVDGALWGLIVCHHRTPRLPSFVVRTAAELFGQMYSMTLESRLRHAQDRDDLRGREAVTQLLASIEANNALLTHAEWLRDQLRPTIPCDGIAVSFNGTASTSGDTPPVAHIAIIAQRASLLPDHAVFATDNIAALTSPTEAEAQRAAGVLCMPLSTAPEDYLMLFRRERHHEVHWAGKPEKADSASGDLQRLSPRKSFAAYTESIRGRSHQFNESERRVAELLRAGLSQGVLRGSHQADAERQHVMERQELLIAELNHRVRNVLALIRGLISQTSGEGGDAASYVKTLSGRVQALARAHDRVTRQNWGPAALHTLFDDEIAAYVPARRDRFTITGDTVLLQPQAFSTLALIIHELVTNSAKYGSLSENGRVEVTLDHKIGQGLFFKWCEKNGPPVAPPTRRGFGSVIIERIVPFDLQGTAQVQYLATGLEADFYIPERHIAPSRALLADHTATIVAANLSVQVMRAVHEQPLQGLKVLLLEDNLIVALEAEDVLKALGAELVHTASTIADATAYLDLEKPDFAVLDINLGFETSLDFGMRLRQLAIPFVYATGYGERKKLNDDEFAVLTVTKPYDREHLGVAISHTLDLLLTERPTLQ